LFVVGIVSGVAGGREGERDQEREPWEHINTLYSSI